MSNRRVTSRFPPWWPDRITLAHAAVFAGAMALSLAGFQQLLKLPGGHGIEHLLGWNDLESVRAAVVYWCGVTDAGLVDDRHLRWHIAAAYVLVDTCFFMPLYALLLLLGAAQIRSALRVSEAKLGTWLRKGLMPAAIGVLAILLAIDAIENHGGAERIGLPGRLFWLCLACGAAFGVALWIAAVSAQSAWRKQAVAWALGAFIAGAVLVGWSVFSMSAAAACVQPGVGLEVGHAGSWAHGKKGVAVLAAFAVVVLPALLWLFGADLDASKQKLLRAQRAAFRSGVSSIVGRTRYVVIVLALFAALTVVSDQCRDVLLGLAHWPRGSEWATWRGWWGLLTVVGTAGALGLFVYSTWLWARLDCRVRRLGTSDSAGPADPDGQPDPVPVWLGTFARLWARFLSIVPLMCVYALIASTLSDAVAAGSMAGDRISSGQHTLGETVVMLILFGAMSVGLGVAFLWVRGRLALLDPAAYFNQAIDVHELLSGDDTSALRRKLPASAEAALKTLRWLTPRLLPLLALLLMVALRTSVALWPNEAASAPAALALVTLALTWWMGVFGALALAEVSQARPYVLIVIVLIGVFGIFPGSDNHVLPLALPMGSDLPEASWRLHNAAVIVLLGALAGGLWWLTTSRTGTWTRVIGCVVAVFVGVVVLRGFDRLVAIAEPIESAAASERVAARPDLATALRQWKAGLPGEGPIFLIAAEGGGIRSAYWTAQALRRLRANVSDFDRRTFALSGVSGGAVGIAAYSACLRQLGAQANDVTLDACLKDGFARLDVLSPLLAGWMFDDALARVLPTPMGSPRDRSWFDCHHPGCGHLSRVLGFEHEWQRVFPAMAQPLQAPSRNLPHLFLNSTWVESGELASATTIRLESRNSALAARPNAADNVFPATRDVQARLGRELSLIGAAHVAARFPFVNPLAAVHPAGDEAVDAPKKGLAGHLADGGYFDNSGTTSLSRVWSLMRESIAGAHRPVLVLIRNGQKPARCETVDPAAPGRDCVVPTWTPLASASQLQDVSRSRSWNLYADVLGPIVAVLNVSGIGAHGRSAPADLRLQLARVAGTIDDDRVLMIDQVDDGTLVPLGWYLSATARDALDRQADRLGCALGKRFAAASARHAADCPDNVVRVVR